MATQQFPSRYALIVTGHAGPLGPENDLLEELVEQAKSLTNENGSVDLPGYATFVANEHYHFVAPFESFSELEEWPSVARALSVGDQTSLNAQIDAAFSGVDTQIIEYREEYSNWSAGTSLPRELIAITLSVDHTKWSEFHQASKGTVQEMKTQFGRQWITFCNRTGDTSKFHVLVDAAEDWWSDGSRFERLLGSVSHSVNKRLVHKPELSTLN